MSDVAISTVAEGLRNTLQQRREKLKAIQAQEAALPENASPEVRAGLEAQRVSAAAAAKEAHQAFMEQLKKDNPSV